MPISYDISAVLTIAPVNADHENQSFLVLFPELESAVKEFEEQYGSFETEGPTLMMVWLDLDSSIGEILDFHPDFFAELRRHGGVLYEVEGSMVDEEGIERSSRLAWHPKTGEEWELL